MPDSTTMQLDGISMNIQEENSASYFRVQSEREQTLARIENVRTFLGQMKLLMEKYLLYIYKKSINPLQLAQVIEE